MDTNELEAGGEVDHLVHEMVMGYVRLRGENVPY